MLKPSNRLTKFDILSSDTGGEFLGVNFPWTTGPHSAKSQLPIVECQFFAGVLKFVLFSNRDPNLQQTGF